MIFSDLAFITIVVAWSLLPSTVMEVPQKSGFEIRISPGSGVTGSSTFYCLIGFLIFLFYFLISQSALLF